MWRRPLLCRQAARSSGDGGTQTSSEPVSGYPSALASQFSPRTRSICARDILNWRAIAAGFAPASNAARMTFARPGAIGTVRLLALAATADREPDALLGADAGRAGGQPPSASKRRLRRSASSVTARNSLPSWSSSRRRNDPDRVRGRRVARPPHSSRVGRSRPVTLVSHRYLLRKNGTAPARPGEPSPDGR